MAAYLINGKRAADAADAVSRLVAAYPAFIRAYVTDVERSELADELAAMQPGDVTTHYGKVSIKREKV